MAHVVRVKLTGKEAQLGRVPAHDVAELLLGIERAVVRAAGHVVGRQVKDTGRWEATLASAARLRLVAIEAGSVVGVLELPGVDDANGFGLAATTLSELAWSEVLDSVTDHDDSRIDVVRAVAELGTKVGIGTRYEAVELIDEEARDEEVMIRTVRIDGPTYRQLRAVANSAPGTREAVVVGSLVEADFERMSARVRTPAGDAVVVEFDESLADSIQDALRRPMQFEGVVSYDPNTLVVRSVRIRAIKRPEQLLLISDPHDFWRRHSIAELAQLQGVGPVKDIETLHDHELSADDVDALFAALEE
jgi:hypothetical protein